MNCFGGAGKRMKQRSVSLKDETAIDNNHCLPTQYLMLMKLIKVYGNIKQIYNKESFVFLFFPGCRIHPLY